VNHAVVQEFTLMVPATRNVWRNVRRSTASVWTWMVLALAALRVIPPGAFVLASSA